MHNARDWEIISTRKRTGQNERICMQVNRGKMGRSRPL